MPKESVYGPSPLQIDRSEFDPNRLDVGWGHETTVNVGILKHAGEPGTPYDDGFWVELDRGAINRLITVLRKARDQAYGVDQ